MKIKIFFVHPTNYGNMMMVDSFVSYFRKIMIEEYGVDPEFYLDVLDDDELTLAKKNVPKDITLIRENIFNRKRRGIFGKLQKLVYIPYEIYYNIKNYDMCIILGGDCISQYYSKQVFISNMIKIHFISKKSKVFAAGQTMGPFKGYAVKLVKWALNRCVIYTRDHDCYRYLKDLFDFEQLYESRDLATLDIPYQNDKNIVLDTLNKYVGNCKYVTFVPSGANLQYTTDTEHYVDEYARIITTTIERTSYDILLLAHVIHVKTSNDKVIIDRIVKKISPNLLNRIHVINHLIMPYEARILLGNGQYTVTGRMHAAVSSINMGVVPICLSYSVKYKGVIGDVYGLNEYILQCRGNEAWLENKVSDKIWVIQQNVLNNKEELKGLINRKNNTVKELALWQIKDIVKRIAE